jgi:hypothetical protein
LVQSVCAIPTFRTSPCFPSTNPNFSAGPASVSGLFWSLDSVFEFSCTTCPCGVRFTSMFFHPLVHQCSAVVPPVVTSPTIRRALVQDARFTVAGDAIPPRRRKRRQFRFRVCFGFLKFHRFPVYQPVIGTEARINTQSPLANVPGTACVTCAVLVYDPLAARAWTDSALAVPSTLS